MVRQRRRGSGAVVCRDISDSALGAVHQAPDDYPGGKKGDVRTVEFTVAGVACLGLTDRPIFKHSEAFSFQIETATQEETDLYLPAMTQLDCSTPSWQWTLAMTLDRLARWRSARPH